MIRMHEIIRILTKIVMHGINQNFAQNSNARNKLEFGTNNNAQNKLEFDARQ